MLKYSFEVLEEFWSSVSGIWDGIWEGNDDISGFKEMEKEMVLNLIEEKNSKIIDLGCGTGRILKSLSDEGFKNLYGLDISSEMIKRCREKLENCIFLHHDMRTRLPFEDDFFDFITIIGNTLTSIDEPKKVLKEVVRVLKINGKVVVDAYNADFLEELVEKYYKGFPKEFEFKRFDKKNNTVYLGKVFSKWITENELKKLMESTGLKVDSIQKKGIGLIAVAKKE